MNMKVKKIISILLTAMMMFAMVTPVFAAGSTVGGVAINPDTTAGEKAGNIGNKVLGIIQVVGSLVAVGSIMILGIKYMMGSAEEKAEYKKTLIPYFIGAVLLFAAVNLAGMFANMAGQIS